MNFYEKETALLSRMKEDGFNTLFNGDQDEASNYLLTHFQSIIGYVIGHTSNNISILVQGQDAVGDAVNSDNALYNEATTSIASINRLSNMLGMGDLFDVDLEDTDATKKFLRETGKEIYQEAFKNLSAG